MRGACCASEGKRERLIFFFFFLYDESSYWTFSPGFWGFSFLAIGNIGEGPGGSSVKPSLSQADWGGVGRTNRLPD